MDQDGEFRPSPIKGLPVELLRMTLGFLPDVQSLHAAVFSCPLFYRAFWNAETTITTQVLLNQIDVSVLPEATIAFESVLLPRQSDPGSREAVADFVAQKLGQRTTALKSWSLREALRLSWLHFVVDALTKRFVEDTLVRDPLSRFQLPVTHQEICRIQRVLYLYELYCILSDKASRPRQEFFTNFAAQENEQLHCIHDFLVRVVAPTFNDVAEHDVAWGRWNVETILDSSSPYAQYILSRGLENVYEVASAKTYEQRYQVLDATLAPCGNVDFLSENYYNVHQGVPPFCSEHPFFKDPDPGPLKAWRWADGGIEMGYLFDCDKIREWGYVMWDQVRLEKSGIFEEFWEDLLRNYNSFLEEDELDNEKAYVKMSWKRRETISRAGGSGWWSWADESQVKWGGKVTPYRPGEGASYMHTDWGILGHAVHIEVPAIDQEMMG